MEYIEKDVKIKKTGNWAEVFENSLTYDDTKHKKKCIHIKKKLFQNYITKFLKRFWLLLSTFYIYSCQLNMLRNAEFGSTIHVATFYLPALKGKGKMALDTQLTTLIMIH